MYIYIYIYIYYIYVVKKTDWSTWYTVIYMYTWTHLKDNSNLQKTLYANTIKRCNPRNTSDNSNVKYIWLNFSHDKHVIFVLRKSFSSWRKFNNINIYYIYKYYIYKKQQTLSEQNLYIDIVRFKLKLEKDKCRNVVSQMTFRLP